MKSLLVIMAVFSSMAISAQKNISISHTINDNGNQLSIKINGTVNGRAVDYDKTFDVTGLNKDQRNAIKHHVYDSLGLPDPVGPKAPLKLSPSAVPEPTPPAPVISSGNQFSELYAMGGDHPYTKEVKYNPVTGLLYMKYRFIKKGEEVTVEKSVEAKDTTKEERAQMVRKYEREIGILPPEII